MSIKIHHGPPGSYKTAGAIADDLIPAAKAGRVIITNVRGMTYDRFVNSFDDLPDTFDLINIDTSTADGKIKMQEWFRWVPEGAFLHIDEAQDIFPKRWRDSDLQRFDFPGGADAAKAAGRPVNWEMAWDMHRHWNWDIVLTTPNIAKIRDDIRGASEGAFKHKNLGLLGIGGRYIEGFHLAEDSGKYDKDFISVSGAKRIPKIVWGLYESTTTGVFSDTKAGLSILKNPRILFFLFVFLGALAFVFRDGYPKNPVSGASVPVVQVEAKPDSASDSEGGSARSASVVSVPVNRVSLGEIPANLNTLEGTPYEGADVFIVGSYQVSSTKKFRYVFSVDGVEIDDEAVRRVGYTVDGLDFCFARLKYNFRVFRGGVRRSWMTNYGVRCRREGRDRRATGSGSRLTILGSGE
jgi:zona occludens toxin